MTITLNLDTNNEADLRFLANNWGKSVDETAGILIVQRLKDVRNDPRLIYAFGNRREERPMRNLLNELQFIPWNCDREQIIERVGAPKVAVGKCTALALVLFSLGVSRIDPNDPRLKSWVAAVKACKLASAARAAFSTQHRIPFISTPGKQLKGEPLPMGNLDRCEPFGGKEWPRSAPFSQVHMFPPAADVAKVRAWAAEWQIKVPSVVRLAVHLGLMN